ncbi:LEAF RUST 10 DISEASE-RESISTANCE LOCUS RECEPTOR-LIKE PROTEIN KINASE-like 2.4 [Bidens hawaiensis]|uniref:LEAF RUST 10 DISEASE-RESISTANCE LOCUS RECEPTOR-LIKE PROTEIN KINASE-like 2.4 n=1 Tax=Bidens hawaiensis TaxID=980011 RepID=UPI00404B67C7
MGWCPSMESMNVENLSSDESHGRDKRKSPPVVEIETEKRKEKPHVPIKRQDPTTRVLLKTQEFLKRPEAILTVFILLTIYTMDEWTRSLNVSIIMSHLLYLTFLLLSIFFISLFAQFDNPDYPNCPSSRCGDVNISYPFWRMDEPASRSQSCGYQGFGIDCYATDGDSSVPRISLSGSYYNVRNISYHYPYNTIHLSAVDQLPDDCPGVRHNITLGTLPLIFTMITVNISFHFNCTGFPSFATEIPRLGNNERKSCVHVMNDTTEETDWGQYSCSEEAITAVVKDRTGSLPDLSRGLGELLQRGFELDWGSMDDDQCDKCEQSDGRCGHDTRGFICFCSGGSITRNDCEGSNINFKTKLVIGFGSVLVGVIFFVIYCLWKLPSSNCVASQKHKTEDDKNVEAFVMHYGSLSTKRYKYTDIKKMTNSFKVKLGQGGFGQVYKGKLPDGRLVAVKVLNSSKANGQEFINEVASIGRTSHVNIVTLLGFCFEYKNRALVYEYMPNGSLEKFIHTHAPTETSENIGVKRLYEIAHGIACGLDYLHRGCNTRILHLDIKPHNILLDEDLCPKIADFGLAKLYSRKESIVSMLEARGTIGYIAPEVYNKNFGGVSHKSDVYSYGMLLLEMVGGRKNVDADVGSGRTSEIYFPDWIYKRLHKDDFVLDSVTTAEENDYTRKMTIVGLWCIQPAPNQRPSIYEVIEMLEGSMEALKVPPKPFFSSPPRWPATVYSTSESMLEVT